MTIIFPIILPNPCTSDNSGKICTFSIEDKAINCDQKTGMAVLPRKHFTNKESSLYRSKTSFHCQFKRFRSLVWFRLIKSFSFITFFGACCVYVNQWPKVPIKIKILTLKKYSCIIAEKHGQTQTNY